MHLAETLGLSVESDGYQGGDMRCAHRVHLVNGYTGFEMVITQTPQSDENTVLGNCLETDILSYGTNNKELGNRIAAEALRDILGVRQEDVRTVEGFEERCSDRRQCTDMNAWKREQVQVPHPGPAAKPQTGRTSTRPAVKNYAK